MHKLIRSALFIAGITAPGLGLLTFAPAARADTPMASPVTANQQTVLVLTAVDVTENAQCGVKLKPVTFARLAKNGMTVDDVSAVSGKFYQQFFVTMEAISQLYLADPKGFCRRAALHQNAIAGE